MLEDEENPYPDNPRINQYDDMEAAYRGWLNTVILHFVYMRERPIRFTPMIRAQCHHMFEIDTIPEAAALWICSYYDLYAMPKHSSN